MEDITPGLLEKIQKQFYHDIEKSSIIKNFKKQAQRGKTSYSQANEVAQEIGKILAQSYSDNLSSDILPDGKMYYNIASRVLDPTLRGAYEMVADNAAIVQQTVNEAAGIGIKTIRAQIQQDNIDGIVNRISSEEYFDDVKWILDAPVRNLVQKAMDDTVQKNADFHAKAGLRPKIIRRSSGHCCEWCNQVAGTYVYPDVPKDVFRRHDNCDCIVEYYPGDGKKQNVWTKEWKYEKESDKIEERKAREKNELAIRIAEHPKMFQAYTPEGLKKALEKAGYEVKPLGRGSLKGIPFEEGGGFRVSYDGDGYLQYHPETNSHHGEAYYKTSSGRTGTKRYNLNGDEKND